MLKNLVFYLTPDTVKFFPIARMLRKIKFSRSSQDHLKVHVLVPSIWIFDLKYFWIVQFFIWKFFARIDENLSRVSHFWAPGLRSQGVNHYVWFCIYTVWNEQFCQNAFYLSRLINTNFNWNSFVLAVNSNSNKGMQ